MAHSVNDCFSTALDFLPYDEKLPSINIMLAATPRCGGTYIATEMWKTGNLGAPLEYANPKMSPGMAKCESEAQFRDYWHATKRARTSPNGVFSFKMFPSYLSGIANNLENAIASIEFDYIIYIYREDILKQAISHARALQTNRWFSEFREIQSPVYRFEDIQNSLRYLIEQTIIWEKIIEKYSIRPIILSYEEFCRDRRGALQFIYQCVGIEDQPQQNISVPTLSIQRDSVSKVWQERYLVDCGKAGDIYPYLLSHFDCGRIRFRGDTV